MAQRPFEPSLRGRGVASLLAALVGLAMPATGACRIDYESINQASPGGNSGQGATLQDGGPTSSGGFNGGGGASSGGNVGGANTGGEVTATGGSGVGGGDAGSSNTGGSAGN